MYLCHYASSHESLKTKKLICRTLSLARACALKLLCIGLYLTISGVNMQGLSHEYKFNNYEMVSQSVVVHENRSDCIMFSVNTCPSVHFTIRWYHIVLLVSTGLYCVSSHHISSCSLNCQMVSHRIVGDYRPVLCFQSSHVLLFTLLLDGVTQSCC